MTLHGDVYSALTSIVETKIVTRDGRVVPRTDDVALKDGGVNLRAVFLYADLMGSTSLAANHPVDTTARVIRGYLSIVSRILIHNGGQIRSFDGDRVMAVFIGDDAADKAVNAAMQIKWSMKELMQHVIYLQFRSIRNSGWVPMAGIGMDIGDALMVRGGVRNNSDLVSIGDAPNIAAKLSEIRGRGVYTNFITDRMWDAMGWNSCYSKPAGQEHKCMWKGPESIDLGGRTELVHSSNWHREIK